MTGMDRHGWTEQINLRKARGLLQLVTLLRFSTGQTANQITQVVMNLICIIGIQKHGTITIHHIETTCCAQKHLKNNCLDLNWTQYYHSSIFYLFSVLCPNAIVSLWVNIKIFFTASCDDFFKNFLTRNHPISYSTICKGL